MSSKKKSYAVVTRDDNHETSPDSRYAENFAAELIRLFIESSYIEVDVELERRIKRIKQGADTNDRNPRRVGRLYPYKTR